MEVFKSKLFICTDFHLIVNVSDTTMVFNHREFPNNEHQKPPKLPPKRNFYKITQEVNEGILDRRSSSNEIPYLDQPTSSFV